MENKLELKTINELCQFSFFVPAYQRGYRWTPQEVNDLLDDVNDFSPRQIENTDDKTWYCLQPIVIKSKQNKSYEVIDGQQRLTTIYLVLQYLNQDFIESRRDKLLSLDYETREDTKEFLNDIENVSNENLNIDHFHVYRAYLAISKWFSAKGSNFNKDEFRSKFKFNTKIVWYESIEEDSISVFTRLNIGKISLSNSELIKALFLSSSNHPNSKGDKLRQKQLEIATEWDIIENALQDDKLWFFITNKSAKNNRIEFIFDLMNRDPMHNDQYSTFRYFSGIVATKSSDSIDKNWREIKNHFQRFKEWYNERELYHKIGYLLSINAASINDLLSVSSSVNKKDFIAYLDNKIKTDLQNAQFAEIQYGDAYVKRVLLLYNILTMLQNEQDGARFPFDMYKKEDWDVEHINSIKESIPQKDKLIWLHDVKPYIDNSQQDADDLLHRINSFRDEDDAGFTKLFEDIIMHFNSGKDYGDDNSIANLALLDAETNRSYKNAVFPIKRKTIIDRDKSGVFIPLCTKNVFLKYFSEYPPKISFWTPDDRTKYEEDLRRILYDYIRGCVD